MGIELTIWLIAYPLFAYWALRIGNGRARSKEILLFVLAVLLLAFSVLFLYRPMMDFDGEMYAAPSVMVILP